jgi:hypothetical protein
MKVVKVKFKETNEEYFFTSYTAIYENFTKDDIGVVIGSIWNRIKKDGKYENSKVEIKSFPLRAKVRKP